jgi:hypothetical protein
MKHSEYMVHLHPGAKQPLRKPHYVITVPLWASMNPLVSLFPPPYLILFSLFPRLHIFNCTESWYRLGHLRNPHRVDQPILRPPHTLQATQTLRQVIRNHWLVRHPAGNLQRTRTRRASKLGSKGSKRSERKMIIISIMECLAFH